MNHPVTNGAKQGCITFVRVGVVLPAGIEQSATRNLTSPHRL
jgi:hypothetical protein